MPHAAPLDRHDPHADRAPEPGAADPALARRVEEASINAWPAITQLVVDGWLVRFAQGFTKRANSVIPLYPDSQDLAEKVRFCENLYARERLKTVFRVTSIDAHAGLDDYLAERGYQRQDTTEVLYLPLADADPAATPLRLQPLQTWLDIYSRLSGLPTEARPLHESILRRIALPCCHAALGVPEDALACGLAVLEQDLVGLFDIVTRPDVRRAGHGRALVTGLIDWARQQSARTAYLQMVADNLPAAALYRQLGFQSLYRYWYRISS